jgi:hypothetical protein
MGYQTVARCISALLLSAIIAQAQETNSIEQLREQLRKATESFEKTSQEQRRSIDDLKERLEAVQRQQVARSTSAPPAGIQERTPWRPTDPIRLAGQGANYINLSLDALFAAGTSTARDIEQLQLGGHDPAQRGFTVQNVEMVLDGAIDPYFRGQGNVVFFIDPDGETQVELEEAYAETMSLPGNLQFRVGQYFTEFGRHNPTHPHTWGFVDTPLVNGRLFGPDGLRNPGVRLSWLMPTPFYSEFFFSVQNSQGETATSFRSAGHTHGGDDEGDAFPFAFRHPDNDRGVDNLGDLLFTPRYAMSFDVTDNQVVLLGASAAFGPNSRGGEDAGSTDTRIYGVDLTWKWKAPEHHAGFPFVTWQSEAMLRQYDAGAFDWDENGNGAADEGEVLDASTGLPAVVPGETLVDYGFYTQILYGFRKSWVAGLRLDYVTSDRADYENVPLIVSDGTGGGDPLGRDPLRAERWRLSPNLTWYPTEFSKIRLQYNYDDRKDLGRDHSVWLQFEFVLGAHAAHKF